MLLLRQVPAGAPIEGRRDDLLAKARAGCDIGLFVETISYPEWCLFRGSYVTHDGRYYGWMSDGIGRGRLGPRDEKPDAAFVARSVFGCDGSVWIFRNTISDARVRNDFHKPYDAYQMYSWHALTGAADCEPEVVGLAPTMTRCRLLTKDGTLVFQPNIVYFADGHAPGGKVASVKGSGIVLPGEIVSRLSGRTFDQVAYNVMVHVECGGRTRLFIWPHNETPLGPATTSFVLLDATIAFAAMAS